MGHAIRLYDVLCGVIQDNQHPYKYNPLKPFAQFTNDLFYYCRAPYAEPGADVGLKKVRPLGASGSHVGAFYQQPGLDFNFIRKSFFVSVWPSPDVLERCGIAGGSSPVTS